MTESEKEKGRENPWNSIVTLQNSVVDKEH